MGLNPTNTQKQIREGWAQSGQYFVRKGWDVTLRSLASTVFNIQNGDVYCDGKPLEKYKLGLVWEQLRPKEATVPWFSVVWTGFIIPSNCLLVWLIMKGRITTKDAMASWGLKIDIGYVLCDEGIDSKEHLFWKCRFSSHLLKVFLPEITGTAWEAVNDYVITRFAGESLSSKVKILLWCIVSSSI
ncbi:hypothetical protein LINPERHAP1_LOCUS16218 [Linum perenne]